MNWVSSFVLPLALGVAAGSAAVGALGAALPEAAAELLGAGLRPALQAAFLVYAALGGLALLLYLVLVAAAVLEARDQPSTYSSRRPGRHVPTSVDRCLVDAPPDRPLISRAIV